MNETAELMQRFEVAGTRAIVLFGGNPYRLDEVVRYLGTRLNVTVVGTLSEQEASRPSRRFGSASATPLRTRAWAHRARVTPGARLSLPATVSGHRLLFVMPLSGPVRIGEVELFEGDSFEALLEGPTDLVSPASADVFVIEQHVKESP